MLQEIGDLRSSGREQHELRGDMKGADNAIGARPPQLFDHVVSRGCDRYQQRFADGARRQNRQNGSGFILNRNHNRLRSFDAGIFQRGFLGWIAMNHAEAALPPTFSDLFIIADQNERTRRIEKAHRALDDVVVAADDKMLRHRIDNSLAFLKAVDLVQALGFARRDQPLETGEAHLVPALRSAIMLKDRNHRSRRDDQQNLVFLQQPPSAGRMREFTRFQPYAQDSRIVSFV